MQDTPLEDLSEHVKKQREFFASKGTLTLEVRLNALSRFQNVFEAHQDAILYALKDDLGKPTIEAFLSEYYFLLEELRLIRKSLKKWLRPKKAKSPFYFLPCRNRIHREPHGNALVIAPWNYPIQLALSPLAAAVAAGNTVILKPSEEAPATAKILHELIAESFPPEHAIVLQGGPTFTDRLLDHRFDFLFFTGSTNVGKVIAQKAAQHLTPHVLELGGKCPCVVDATANLSIAAKRILVGKLFNAGQTCFAPDFVAVHESAKAKLIEELTEIMERLPWENEIARIINRRHYERLLSLVAGEPVQKGTDDPDALHLAPRILPEAQWSDAVMQQEVFGPILPVVTYRTQDDIIEKLSRYSTPLALYCFSKDPRFTAHLLSNVPSGGVCLNDVGKHASNLHLPFGGKGDSGHGRYRGKAGVEAFSYQRTVSTRFFLPDPFESLPPRAKQTTMLRKWMK
ncbi:MAG: aldehyde dehydrogenase family protein [Verrucomicrobiota bacterium]